MRLYMEKRSELKEEIIECQEETEQDLQGRVRLAAEESAGREKVGEAGSADPKETAYVPPADMKLPILRESAAAR